MRYAIRTFADPETTIGYANLPAGYQEGDLVKINGQMAQMRIWSKGRHHELVVVINASGQG